MAQERLVSFLSPNSNLRSQVASLDAAIDTLKANGMNEQADMFRSNLQQSIANKDIDSLRAYSSQLMAMNSKNMSVPVEQRGQAKPQEEVVLQDELVSNINMLIGTADENNIDLPDAQLKQIAQLAQSNSPRLGKEVAKLESSLNELLKISRDETKDRVTLQDGTQVLRGSKTGTYYQGGSPISRGAINASAFNEMMFAPTRQAAASMPMVGQISEEITAPQVIDAAIQGRPEVYTTGEAVEVQKPLVNVSNTPAPATGYMNVFDDSGNLLRQQLIPGGPADLESQAAKQEAEVNKEKSQKEIDSTLEIGQRTLRTIEDFTQQTKEMSNLPGAGVLRRIGLQAGFSTQEDRQALIDQMSSSAKLGTISKLKDQSVTGATGLGATSDKEFESLSSIVSKMNVSMSPEALRRSAKEYKIHFLNYIHGTPEHRQRLINEGKITQEQNAKIESLYPGGKPPTNYLSDAAKAAKERTERRKAEGQ